MFLITAEHGEYDDFTSIPILVVPDLATAQLVTEECYNPTGEFRQLIAEKHGYPDGMSDGYFEGLGFSYREVEYYEIRWDYRK